MAEIATATPPITTAWPLTKSSAAKKQSEVKILSSATVLEDVQSTFAPLASNLQQLAGT